MKLYKYRSLSRFDFIFDILTNGFVYCSSYKDLNDPFEGQFSKLYTGIQFGDFQFGNAQFGSNTINRESLDDRYFLKEKRICSFSGTGEDIKMWSYYADSHKGVCIEFEIDENQQDFYRVLYVEHLKKVQSDEINNQVAINILKRKTKQWEFEQEIRLICEKERYNLKDCIKSVIIGNRTSSQNEGIIKSICGSIPVKYAILTDDLKISIEDNK